MEETPKELTVKELMELVQQQEGNLLSALSRERGDGCRNRNLLNWKSYR